MTFFPEDFRDFLALWITHNVRFMLVGGYAYNIHVEARVTQDIDVWVKPTRENLLELREALKEFIAADFNVEEGLQLLQTNRLGFGVGMKPNRAEVLLRVKGLEFGEAYARSIQAEVDGLIFQVIHPHDQIINKRAAGRLKDLADVEKLLKFYGEPPTE